MGKEGGIDLGRLLAGVLATLGSLVLLVLAAPSQARIAVAFSVNSTDDTPDMSLADNVCDVSSAPGLQCTLRAAIQQSNAAATGVVIVFSMPGSGPQTIAPATALPQITHTVSIDGYTQAGASANTAPLNQGSNAILQIAVDGVNEPAGASMFDIGNTAGGTLISGLAIERAPGAGILARAATTLTGDFIGTDVTGMKPRGNGFDNVFGFGGAAFVQVGGPSPAERNLICDAGDSAITSNVPIHAQGNLIGVGSDGKKPLGNHFAFHAAALDLAGSSNVIGGPGGAANVIANNEKAGITLANDSPPSTFSRNRIYDNGKQAIDLDEDGRTPNDHLDPDVGPNKLQNFPKLISAKTGKTKTLVKGKLDSNPSTAFTLELFTAPKGTGGARHFIGTRAVTTSATGIARFRFPAKKLRKGLKVSATATATLTGATSELSDRISVRKR